MRQSKRRDVVTADEFEEMLKSLSTPHAMERLDLWDRPVDGGGAESDDDDSEAGAADVAGEVARLRASMVEACAAALEACGAPPSDTTDDDDVSARAKRSRRRKVETFGKQETAVADLEAAVAAAGFYVADGVAGVDDGARAELAIYREAAFWLRALLVAAAALRRGSMKKALRRNHPTVNVATLDKCLAATREDAAVRGVAGADVAGLLDALDALRALRAAVAGALAGADADVSIATHAVHVCCAFLDASRDADRLSPAASLALVKLSDAALDECHGGDVLLHRLGAAQAAERAADALLAMLAAAPPEVVAASDDTGAAYYVRDGASFWSVGDALAGTGASWARVRPADGDAFYYDAATHATAWAWPPADAAGVVVAIPAGGGRLEAPQGAADVGLEEGPRVGRDVVELFQGRDGLAVEAALAVPVVEVGVVAEGVRRVPLEGLRLLRRAALVEAALELAPAAVQQPQVGEEGRGPLLLLLRRRHEGLVVLGRHLQSAGRLAGRGGAHLFMKLTTSGTS